MTNTVNSGWGREIELGSINYKVLEPNMRIIRYTIVPKDVKIVEALGNEAVLKTGTAVVKSGDNASFYVEIAGSLSTILDLLNDKLSRMTWPDKEGIGRAFQKQKAADLDFFIETIKSY